MNADQTPNEEKAVTADSTETVAAGSDSSPAHGSAPKRDPRDYVRGGGRRCAMCKSHWLDDWWISHSPRNDNQNAEGAWEDWVELARGILKADEEWKAQNVAFSDKREKTL